MQIAHLILDRDGVLNVEPPTGFVLDRAAWAWEPGARQALAELTAAGVALSVATNQSCIGRGLVTAGGVDALHAWVLGDARAHGAAIARILVCPHVDADACACRKPRPALLERAIAESGIEPDRTLVLGDSKRDLEAARAAGLASALVRTGKGRAQEASCASLARWVFEDLAAAAAAILGRQPYPRR